MKLGIFRFGVASLLFAGLAGCGGGGDGGGGATIAAPPTPVASTLSFPLQSAYKSLAANGFSKTFSIIGTTPIYTTNNCTGTGTFAVSAANTPAIFETVAGFSATEIFTITGCLLRTSISPTTRYYDTNYNPIGSANVAQYGVFLTPVTLPTSVTVGGAGAVGTETEYTDSAKTVTHNQQVISYLIEPDTASTAIVNFIVQNYSQGTLLTFTEQHRFRIASTGALAPISVDIQETYTYSIAPMHTVITFN